MKLEWCLLLLYSPLILYIVMDIICVVQYPINLPSREAYNYVRSVAVRGTLVTTYKSLWSGQGLYNIISFTNRC